MTVDCGAKDGGQGPWPGRGVTLISGGQTGVDRAALDAALACGLACGGACPVGRLAEDGPIPARYPLQETQSSDYAERTRRNVADADATLIVTDKRLGGGTLLTVDEACRQGKPCLVVDLREQPAADAAEQILAWLGAVRPAVLNVAGPRESQSPGIHAAALSLLTALCRELKALASG